MPNKKIERKAPQLNDGSSFSKHDLSHYFGYKCSTGHAVPVFADVLNPNERVKLRVNSFVRLQPMLTPAFMKLRGQIDYFFVPMELLYMTFGRNFSKTREFFSSFMSRANMSSSGALPLWNGNYASSTPASEIFSFCSYNNDVLSTLTGYDPKNSTRFANDDTRPSFEMVGNRMLRLMDYFGYDLPKAYTGLPIALSALGLRSYYVGEVEQSSITSKNTSCFVNSFPWKILAYNAIWENWYRLDDFIQFDNQLFNVDRIGVSATTWNAFAFVTGNDRNSLEWACIKYVPKKMDYFTSSVNNPVVQNLNILGTHAPQNEQFLSPYNVDLISDYYDANNFVGLSSPRVGSMSLGDVESLSSDYNSSLNMARLRLVKAQEKLLQIYGRLPKKNYDNFVYALFGAKVPHDVKHEISHLGSEDFDINVNAVFNMAASEDVPLGEFAGQGSGGTSDKARGVKFTAPVHGIIMAIQSIRPDYMYAGGFLRENVIQTFNDFFLPPYDNLGRQPVYSYERKPGSTDIIAWQFRWQQWKSRYNRVTRAFQFGSDRSWFLVNDNESNVSLDEEYSTYMFNVNFRYVDPCSLNDIMAVQFIPYFAFEVPNNNDSQATTIDDCLNYYYNPALLYATDPFICLSRIDCSKFSKMSVYSLQTID